MVGNRDLREHLNDLWKTTVDQFDEIKDVILRNSHVGRKKLDTAFLRRQRDRLLQDLGEAVYEQVRAGTLELPAEGQRLIERVTEVLGQIEAEEAEIARLAALGVAPSSSDDEPTLETRALDPDGVPVAPPAARPAASAVADEAVSSASPVDEVPATGDIEDAVSDPSPRRRRRRSRRGKKAGAETDAAASDDEN